MAAALASKAGLAAKASVVRTRRASRVAVPAIRAENASVDMTRRSMLGLAAGIAAGAALVAVPEASFAAYGQSANVFGKMTNTSGFIPYAGDGFVINLPSKWNPSKEKDFAGVTLRYEDNFDAVNNLVVIKQKSDKGKIEDYGSPEAFLPKVTYLLGAQAYNGETLSEGGFAPNRVSAASILDVGSKTDKKGKTYYQYEILTRTADGDEGGRHQLITATVGSDNNLYILKVQAGDKRWFKGAKKECVGATDSFTVV